VSSARFLMKWPPARAPALTMLAERGPTDPPAHSRRCRRDLGFAQVALLCWPGRS
jgi:hypothetical protein